MPAPSQAGLKSKPSHFLNRTQFPEEESPVGYHHRIHIEIGKDHRISYPEPFYRSSSSHGSGEGRGVDHPVAMVVPEVSHLGWGHWYTLRELEASTNGFADENVIGEGGYGIVYHGILEDKTQVAVKNLLNNRCFLATFIFLLPLECTLFLGTLEVEFGVILEFGASLY